MPFSTQPSERHHRSWRSASALGTGFGIKLVDTWVVLWGLLAPAVYLLMAATFDGVDWQSGRLADYFVLLHGWPHLVMVYPLAAFSAAGLGVFFFAEEERQRDRWVGFAVVGGAVLWVELAVAWVGAIDKYVGGPPVVGGLLTATLAPLAGLSFALPFAALAYGVGGSSRDADAGNRAAAAFIGVMALSATVPAFFVWFLAVIFAAPLAALTYGLSAYRLLAGALAPRGRAGPRRGRFSVQSLMLIGTWLAYNLAAWRWAVLSMMAEYRSLPTAPPSNCFVASAAARGHGQLVGADASGVNRQLRTLKAAEIAFRLAAPKPHRAARWVYNRLGPRVAAGLTNPWLADAAFLLLKPLEWGAWPLLRAARVTPKTVDSLYRPRRGGPSRRRLAATLPAKVARPRCAL